jgi:hypothetical protein
VPSALKRGEGKSLTTSRLEKAGAAAPAQQPEVGKLVKVAVGGKRHRRGGKTTSHMSCKKTSWPEKTGAAAHAQQSGVGKLVKVAVEGKLHKRVGKDPLPM